MNVIFCASEVFPYAKTGGLADVCGALPLALEKLGIEVTVFLPHYQTVDPQKFPATRVSPSVSRTVMGKNVQVYFVENKSYYDRPGLYGDRQGDYPDNLERFSFYCATVLETLKTFKTRPDIIHCHDWQAALIPAYLRTRYAQDPFFKGAKTILTLHNLAYQGIFPQARFPVTGLDEKLFNPDAFEFFHQVNLLKGGIVFSDIVTTVSRTYAKEIQSERLGCGLDGVLRSRYKDITGILNGIDYEIWDPAKDPLIHAPYSASDPAAKGLNKQALQKEFHLPMRDDVPLFGFVGRLSHQKGIDLIGHAMEQLGSLDVQMVIQGIGDAEYHSLLQRMMAKNPDKVSLHLGFDERIAHQIYAGSDFFLMPSVYEPCGLSQMIGLRYGSIPVVYRTGGLADTIQPYARGGNGFLFEEHTPEAFVNAVKAAMKVFQDKAKFEALVEKALGCHFSWEDSAREYVSLYEKTTQ